MKLKINNDKFKDIRTISIKSPTGSRLLYLSCTDKTRYNNFLRYKNEFLPETESDEFLLNLLGKDSVDKLEKNLDTTLLDFFEGYLVPTLSDSDESEVKFFGTMLISNNNYLPLQLSDSESNVFLYDTYVDKKDLDKISPVVEVVLEGDELVGKKIIWVVTSSEKNSISRINVSLASFLSSEAPCRNLHKVLTRNDRLARLDYEGVLENDSNTLLDISSGTLLGQVEKIEKPLLTKLVARSETLKKNLTSNSILSIGTVKSWNEKDWVYLGSTDKFSDNPAISSDWILLDQHSKIRKTSERVVISSIPIKGGAITPGNIVHYPSNNSFSIKPSTGYVLNKQRPCSNGKEDIPKQHYTLSSSNGEDTVKITNWSTVLKTGNLFFNFSSTSSEVYLISKQGSTTIDYVDWEESFNGGLRLERFFIDDIETPTNFSKIVVPSNSRIKLHIRVSDLINIDSVGSTNNSSNLTWHFDPEDKALLIVEDVVVETKTTYTLNIEVSEVHIEIEDYNGIVTSTNYIKCSSGTELVSFKFKGGWKELTIGEVKLTTVDTGKEVPIDSGSSIKISLLSAEIFLVEITNLFKDLKVIIR